MARHIMPFFILGTLLLATAVEAQRPLDKLLDMFKGMRSTVSPSLSDTRIAEGLKEALRISTDHAVVRTGTLNGYFGNPRIRILLPEQLQSVEKGLRLVGYGDEVDAFIVSMNRAAEQAAPQAKQIFLQAITAMTFDDARRILNGSETAATDFFKDKTTASLYQKFRPIVDRTLNQLGTVQKYNALLRDIQRIPFVKAETLEVGDYVTSKALDGLFLVIAEEERNIRQNPAARITTLLQEVFGR
jgi:hypothetical protein